MKLITPDGCTDTETETLDELTEARRCIDEVVAELGEDEDVSYQHLLAALESTRDTVLVHGHIPNWFGDAASPHYREMVWGYY